ncbi:MAG: RsmB/NOP family class I SAM-dependent RNA methyltransferase [Pseudomonadota bacterium]
MTPAAHVQAAIEVLDRILDGAPAERALMSWARESRYAGAKDRAAVRDHVFEALRRRNSFAWLGGARTGRGLMIGAARSAHSDLDQVFSGIAYGPPELTQAERHLNADLADAPLPVRYDLPDWLLPHVETNAGELNAELLEALRHRAPLDLRVNHLKSDVETARSALAEDGIETDPVEGVSTALRVVTGARKVSRARAFLDGLVEIQDASSQAAVLAAEPSVGASVLDYCAGGGGKALALTALTGAPVMVHDSETARMRDIPVRAARAGAVCPLWDGQGAFDMVFVDAPCSGSGTWRRIPDAKWRLTQARLVELVALQAQVLRAASAYVGRRGRLVYATCSVLGCENAEQVQDFLVEMPGWVLSKTRRFDPNTAGDGFFVAILERE